MLYRPIESASKRALTTVESDPISLTSSNTDEVDVLTVLGPVPGVSVWFQGPEEFYGAEEDVTVRLYARVAGIRAELTSARLSLIAKTTSESGGVGALVLSCQGIPAEAYELTVQRSEDGASSLTGGRLVLYAAQEPAPLAIIGEGGLSAAVRGTRLNPVYIRMSDVGAAYAASTEVHSGTATTPRLLLHLWHPSVTTKRFEIRRVAISYFGVTDTARLTLRGTRISSSTASSAPGDVVTPESFDPDEGASSASVRRTPTTSSSTAGCADTFMATIPTTESGVFVWEASDYGRPFVLPSDQGGGLEIRSTLDTTITTAMPITISIEWLEV